MWLHIDVLSIILFVVIGLVAGWLAGLVFRGRGFGLLGNLISAFVGAVIFVLIIILIKRA